MLRSMTWKIYLFFLLIVNWSFLIYSINVNLYVPNRRYSSLIIEQRSQILALNRGMFSRKHFYLHQICDMSHVATNKVKGDFYCPGYFLLFVLVSFMGLFRIPNNRPNRVPRFVQEISVVDQYWLQPLAAAFQDIFNNSYECFIDTSPVSGSENNVIKNARHFFSWKKTRFPEKPEMFVMFVGMRHR